MDKTQEALKMAIEAMSCISQSRGDPLLKAIRACKEALEQPAQEPVDVARVQEDGYVEWNPDLPDLPVGTKLYTHPAPSWQGLSDDEKKVLHKEHHLYIPTIEKIEAMLKEKNHV